MTVRLVCKPILAAGFAALLGLGALASAPLQAGAAVHRAGKVARVDIVGKKHPKHHGSSAKTQKKLKLLKQHVARESHATFEVAYSINAGGKTESITFAQAPPKVLVKTTAGSLIDTGTETLFCSATYCVGEGSTNPVSSLENLFSPTTAENFFQQAAAEAGAAQAGYSIKFSSASYGGQKSECASVKGHGYSEKYCVSNIGLLTFASSPGGTIQLTSYTGTVPATDFSPPSGATIVTVPTT